MKELSIEEKAKAYDIALDKIKRLLGTGSNCSREELEYVFPELKESEDERIRKALITFFQRFPYERIDVAGTNAKEAIAWLEKQGEKTVDKLQVSDELYEHIRNTCACIDDALSSKTLDDINDYLSMAERSAQSAFDMIEQRGKETTDNDIKEALRTEYEKGRADAIAEVQKSAWSEVDDKYNYNIIIGVLKSQGASATSQDLQYERQINWLKSLKDRIQPQPKQEWNEEDEDILNTIINHFEIDLECTKNDDIIRWLKNLKDRYTWNPSDEQMIAIDTAINVLGKGTLNGKQLIELQEQLKKLK